MDLNTPSNRLVNYRNLVSPGEDTSRPADRRGSGRQGNVHLRAQFLLGNRPRVVGVDLVADAGTDALSAGREPLAHEPRPRVAKPLVRSHVDGARVAARRQPLFDQFGWQ